MEDNSHMKKFKLAILLVLLVLAVASSQGVAYAQTAQDDKAAQDKAAQDAAAQQADFERVWHPTCYKKPVDEDKCYQLSKELLEKYPDTTFKEHAIRIIKAYEQNKAWEKFTTALDAYYKVPEDVGKLEQLFSTGEAYYKFVPDHPSVVAQLAIAGTNA